MFANFKNNFSLNCMKNIMFILVFLFYINCDLFFRSNKQDFVKTPNSIEAKNQDEIQDRKNTIILTTLDWQPYIGQDLPNYGYVYQIVKKIYEQRGYKVVIKFYPWARTMQLAASGEIDGYFPEYYNEDLKKDFYFSDPYPGGPAGFYGRKDINYKFKTQYDMKDFHALTSYRIGIVRGYTNTKYFDSANYLQKEETTDDLSNLKKLYYNRVQLIFIDPNVANYLIRTYLIKQYPDYFEKTYFITPELEYKFLYVCIARKAPYAQKKLQDFNAGLKELKQTGELNKLLRENHFNEKGIWDPSL